MKSVFREILIIVLLSAVFLTAFEREPRAEIAAELPESSEYMAVGVFMVKSDGEFLVRNLDIVFTNEAGLPLNTSVPAFTDRFRSARFSVVGVGAFLRVSYDSNLGISQSESYADNVFSAIQDAFALPITVIRKTHDINNVTQSVDVYYELGGIGWNTATFRELLKYNPRDGFGELLTQDLLSQYLKLSPDVENQEYGVYGIEYNLTRTAASFVWVSSFSAGYRHAYQKEDNLDVSLNALLNHSGSITPSILRSSQIFISIDEIEHTQTTPLKLRFSSSSLPYTESEEKDNVLTLTYNLTNPVDDITVTISIIPEAGFNRIYVALAVVAVLITSIAVVVFIRVRRKKLQQK